MFRARQSSQLLHPWFVLVLIMTVCMLFSNSNKKNTIFIAATSDGDPDDPANPCSTHALNAYRKCVRDNPCVCRNCFEDPNDPAWVIDADEPNSCQDISRIFCPAVRCCSPCEAEFSFYHSCLADKIASIYLGDDHNCQLFICASEHNNDYLGDCGPTPAPVPPTDPCRNEVEAYEQCASQDSTCQGCRVSDLSFLYLETAVPGTTTCETINRDLFCSLEQCCPACQDELNTVSTCVESNLAITQPDDQCPQTKCAELPPQEDNPQDDETLTPPQSDIIPQPEVEETPGVTDDSPDGLANQQTPETTSSGRNLRHWFDSFVGATIGWSWVGFVMMLLLL